jgi:hypothetical protein
MAVESLVFAPFFATHGGILFKLMAKCAFLENFDLIIYFSKINPK